MRSIFIRSDSYQTTWYLLRDPKLNPQLYGQETSAEKFSHLQFELHHARMQRSAAEGVGWLERQKMRDRGQREGGKWRV